MILVIPIPFLSRKIMIFGALLWQLIFRYRIITLACLIILEFLYTCLLNSSCSINDFYDYVPQRVYLIPLVYLIPESIQRCHRIAHKFHFVFLVLVFFKLGFRFESIDNSYLMWYFFYNVCVSKVYIYDFLKYILKFYWYIYSSVPI